MGGRGKGKGSNFSDLGGMRRKRKGHGRERGEIFRGKIRRARNLSFTSEGKGNNAGICANHQTCGKKSDKNKLNTQAQNKRRREK